MLSNSGIFNAAVCSATDLTNSRPLKVVLKVSNRPPDNDGVAQP